MKINPKLTLIVALGLFSINIMATQLPPEIYQPQSAEILKSQMRDNGGYEAEFKVNAGHIGIKELAARIIAHARAEGFSVEQSMIKRNDADISFYRDNQGLKVSLELKNPYLIEYKAEFEPNKN